jgi:hypothetical protein
MHVPDINYNTNCRTFVLCLQRVKTWSDAHSDHTPIVINLELKQSDAKVVQPGRGGTGQRCAARHDGLPVGGHGWPVRQ